jgi:hypothetical protein
MPSHAWAEQCLELQYVQVSTSGMTEPGAPDPGLSEGNNCFTDSQCEQHPCDTTCSQSDGLSDGHLGADRTWGSRKDAGSQPALALLSASSCQLQGLQQLLRHMAIQLQMPDWHCNQAHPCTSQPIQVACAGVARQLTEQACAKLRADRLSHCLPQPDENAAPDPKPDNSNVMDQTDVKMRDRLHDRRRLGLWRPPGLRAALGALATDPQQNQLGSLSWHHASGKGSQ